MEAAFKRADANQVATVARTNALTIMVIAGVAYVEKHVRAMFKSRDAIQATHDAKLLSLAATVEACEKQLDLFRPVSYSHREPGTVRTTTMHFSDGTSATVSTTFEKTGATPARDRADRVARLEEDIADLASRIRRLAAAVKPFVDVAGAEFALPLADCGVFRSGRKYSKGTACTHDGSLWIAQRDTDAKPGTPDCGWRLAVKAGRVETAHRSLRTT